MECLGSCLLVMSYGLTGNALAVGLVYASLIYMGGHISGAHYNPAVSFAFWIKNDLTGIDFLLFFLAQITGAFVAGMLLFFFQETIFFVEPPTGTSILQQSAAEIIFTFLLVYVILVVATSTAFQKNNIYGLIIGFSLAGIIFAGGPISGGIFNPVVSAGPVILDSLNGGLSYLSLPVYTLSPMAGAGLAAFIFLYFEKGK